MIETDKDDVYGVPQAYGQSDIITMYTYYPGGQIGGGQLESTTLENDTNVLKPNGVVRET